MHTPDGSPCGLLNHLSHTCRIVTVPVDASRISALLTAHGMSPTFTTKLNDQLVVQLDGRIIGFTSASRSRQLAQLLRRLKIEGHPDIPLELEIGYVPVMKKGQYPGLYLFAGTSRMMRPVTFIPNGQIDFVGSFEQVYMDIAVTEAEVMDGVSTHVEIDPTSILSVVANLTPFSDFNQSPRNMYQVCHPTV